MSRLLRLIIPVLLVLILAACGGNTAGGEQADYDATKKMIVDILKTDEGKKAITEVLSSEEMQQSIALESEVVSQSVSNTLISEKGKAFWTKMFSDPSFVLGFNEVLQDQQKDLMKGLMKDSEYQKLMMDLYQNPEMMDEMVTVMQGQKFQAHLEQTITETLNSPVFQAKMSETLLKAAEDIGKTEGSQQGQGQEQQGNGGGDSQATQEEQTGG
ncbi:spore gernimation protein GerD [Halobacillus fulvus]|nr:spore gernimation protein GerD [Halobacillus fulvus]